MKRNLAALARNQYDLIIIGGGIYGVCAAWDAVLRGLSVALVERGDFGHAASANCFKIVHGGFRYLQHLDVQRIRESSRERNVLLRVAPHLVRPLPIIVPTYGRGLQSRALLRAGLALYDAMTLDRNRSIRDARRHVPMGRAIGREECLQLFPGLDRKGLTGAVVFYDAQMYSPSRLGLSFLRSAISLGLDAANYVEATGFLRDGNRVLGVEARDVLTDTKFLVRGKVVINAAGPWAGELLHLGMGLRLTRDLCYSRDAYFVIRRCLDSEHALALPGWTKDPDAILSRGRRHLFLVPWRNYTLVGVWHKVCQGQPEQLRLTARELQEFVTEVNDSYPSLALTLNDVSRWNAGLVLFGQNKPGQTDLSYGKRSVLIDHTEHHGLDGLVTLIGVRYTLARALAVQAVDLVFQKLGRPIPRSLTGIIPVHGGQIDHFDAFLHRALDDRPPGMTRHAMSELALTYGSEYKHLLKYIVENPTLGHAIAGSTITKAQVVHAVREEMAQKLADVVFRRTELGTAESPSDHALNTCTQLMASEFEWDNTREQQEVREVKCAFDMTVQ